MATIGRRGGPRGGVVFRAETQIETGVEELLRKGGVAAETVDGPLRGGAQLLVQPQNDVESTHHMQREWEAVLFGECDLCGKDRTLRVEISTAQTVEAAFAHLHHFGQGQKVGEGGEVAVEPKIGIGRPPRVDAGRIESADLRVPRFGVEHDGTGKTHNAGAGGRVEAVGVEIEGGSGVLHKWIQGTGSYPWPPQGWQRKMRRTASHEPLKGPCLRSASMAYCEQVGV